MTARRALVTGAAGQDGSYLLERLLDEGYAVHALVRAADRPLLLDLPVTVHQVDLSDHQGLRQVVAQAAPDELYHLAGMSSVARSWDQPVETAEITGVATVVLLDAAHQLQERTGQRVHVVLAASAEIFGAPVHWPQDEDTAIAPVSPYGAAKALAHHAVGVARARGLAASSLILYNHESPRRPVTFVTRKITQAVAAIATSGQGVLRLGNLEARRDWGWAPDYVDAMVRAARSDPGTFVIATGQHHSVADFVRLAFAHVRIEDWRRHVEIDPAFLRPADPALLVGDASRAHAVLGWRPTRDLPDVVAAMVDHDLALIRSGS